MTGFLEESAGVKSLTRLVALLITILAAIVVGVVVWYVLRTKEPSAAVIGALAGEVALGRGGDVPRPLFGADISLAAKLGKQEADVKLRHRSIPRGSHGRHIRS